jgi:pimeloyl-ACP methyl ester carboxylesterase
VVSSDFFLNTPKWVVFKTQLLTLNSPNLTALLLSRLSFDPAILSTTISELCNISYDDLVKVLNEKQKSRWPRALHELVSSQDRKIDEDFPDVPLLLMGGTDDTLVPVKHTEPWVASRKGNKNIEFFVQENTGHSCTKEMVAKMAIWLSDFLAL